jgi:hypothetical protein
MKLSAKCPPRASSIGGMLEASENGPNRPTPREWPEAPSAIELETMALHGESCRGEDKECITPLVIA